MPNDFTASALPLVPFGMENVFKNKGTVNPDLNNDPATLRAVFEMQNANITPIRDGAGNLCIGAKIYYFVNDDLTPFTSSAVPIIATCVIGAGDTMSSEEQTYDLNVFMEQKFSIDALDCDNAAKFLDKVPFKIASTLTRMSYALNDTMIAKLEANKSTPVAGNLPIGVTIAGEYTITGTQYWQGAEAAQIIPILDQLADVKGLSAGYYIIAGKALQIPKTLATAENLNSDGKSYSYLLAGREIFNDPKNLDVIVGAEVIYLVDPAAIFGYITNNYTNDVTRPVPVDDANNTMVFRLPIEYFDRHQSSNMNKRSLMFNNNGTMEQSYVDVRMQKVCATGGKYGEVTYTYNWEFRLYGLIDVIPRAAATNTGIIRVNKA